MNCRLLLLNSVGKSVLNAQNGCAINLSNNLKYGNIDEGVGRHCTYVRGHLLQDQASIYYCASSRAFKCACLFVCFNQYSTLRWLMHFDCSKTTWGNSFLGFQFPPPFLHPCFLHSCFSNFHLHSCTFATFEMSSSCPITYKQELRRKCGLCLLLYQGLCKIWISKKLHRIKSNYIKKNQLLS